MDNNFNNEQPCNCCCTTLSLIGISIIIVFIKLWARGGVNKKQRDLSNQIVIITGSNTGIGLETAKDCAKNGAKVILACRDERRAQYAVDIVNSIRANSAEFIRLDLSDLSSVRLFVNTFKSKYNKLDILINNAGIMHVPQLILTKDGFESQIGTNHFGHFLLTHLLIDRLQNSPQFRVINVSSLAHSMGSINLEDLHFKNRPYSRYQAYAQSKIANILFTIGLQSRVTSQKMNGIIVSLHPGTVRTELSRHWDGIINVIFYLLFPVFYLLSKTPLQGAQTSLYLVHEDFDKLKKGAYYADCGISPYRNKQITNENAERLWEITLQQLKI